MNFRKHFKPEDIATVEAEYICIIDLMILVLKHIENHEFIKAKEKLEDVFKSIKRMESLSCNKYDADLRKEISSSFKNHITFQIIRNYVNE